MGVDTKAFVATPCKDVFFVADRVKRALDSLIRPHWQQGRFSKDPSGYRLSTTELCPDSAMLRIHFQYEGHDRTMSLFFDCDVDRVEFAPQSLTLSMGCSGRSDLFIKTAAHALSMLGPVYYDYNDCDDIPWALLQESPALDFPAACQEKVERPFTSALRQWVKLFDKGLLRAGTFEDVVGVSRAHADEILAMPYEAAAAAMNRLVLRS